MTCCKAGLAPTDWTVAGEMIPPATSRRPQVWWPTLGCRKPLSAWAMLRGTCLSALKTLKARPSATGYTAARGQMSFRVWAAMTGFGGAAGRTRCLVARVPMSLYSSRGPAQTG